MTTDEIMAAIEKLQSLYETTNNPTIRAEMSVSLTALHSELRRRCTQIKEAA